MSFISAQLRVSSASRSVRTVGALPPRAARLWDLTGPSGTTAMRLLHG